MLSDVSVTSALPLKDPARKNYKWQHILESQNDKAGGDIRDHLIQIFHVSNEDAEP